MENTKLNKWAELLLDTGKRNRLVNFQDAKASTVEIVCPDSSVVFEKASGTSSLEVFDPKLADDEIDTSDTVIGEELEAAESSERSATDKMDRATYISVYGNKLRKASQVLLYNKTMNPLTALKNIHKKAKSALDETGVNVAYLAFGFIHWKENEHSHTTYRAPILLAPIAFKHESAISPYYIEFTGDDIVTNPTFSYKLFNDFGVKLPEYNDEGLDEYLEAIRHVVRKFDWQVTSECKVGIFSFLKMNMYRDLVDNADSILQSSNIQRLLGDCPDDERAVHSEATPSHVGNEIIDLHTVVDADSSQIEAIELAKSGASFVLQGPPGTGKSQTITNIIAESLYDGKKVLFVSEKQAALNVVYDKLKKAGLEEFCLELHSYKANKKDVIAELCHTLRSARSTVSSRAETEVELKAKAQKQLDDYAVELHKQRDVKGNNLIIDESGYPCVEVVRGKGGKYQLQRVFEDDVDMVKSLFAKAENEDYLFSFSEMANKIDLHHLRALQAQRAYQHYLKRIENEGRENLTEEIKARWKKYNRKKRWNPRVVRGTYYLRGRNREFALAHGLPTAYDRLALMATSVFHLSHWRTNVCVCNYLLAIDDNS